MSGMTAGTAGTASDGFRSPRAHVYEPAPLEYGRRPSCRHCHADPHPVPTPRKASA